MRAARVTHKLCPRCFFASEQPRKAIQARLVREGLGWATRVVGQFASYLRQRGYSGARIWEYLSRLAAALIATHTSCERDWLETTTQRLSNHLEQQGRLVSLDARLREFIMKRRGPSDPRLATDPARGLTQRVLEEVPDPFADDLRLYHRLLLEEAEYRRRNRELVRSPRTHYGIVRRLARWADWMKRQGLLSWQQLTPDRFREHILELGVNTKPRAVAGALFELRAFFRELVAQRRMFRDPLARIATPNVPGPDSHAVHVGSLRRWLDQLASEDSPAIRRLIGMLVVFHGLTPNELRNLALRDADLRHRTLRVRARRLSIELDPLTFDALRAYVAVRRTCANTHLLITTKTRLSLAAASPGFVMQHLRALGVLSRATRQHLIRTFATQQGMLLAAQYFRLSTNQIGKHMLHQEELFSLSKQ